MKKTVPETDADDRNDPVALYTARKYSIWFGVAEVTVVDHEPLVVVVVAAVDQLTLSVDFSIVTVPLLGVSPVLEETVPATAPAMLTTVSPGTLIVAVVDADALIVVTVT
jgi:hypothetical protein